VRMVLVPVAMKLIGNANWWIPAWLDRLLPTIHGEWEAQLPIPELAADLVPEASDARVGV
jgi:RND superfamily putative drug exporter